MSGLEVEFHVFKVTDPHMKPEHSGQPGAPPDVELLSHGYQYLTALRYDAVDGVMEMLRRGIDGLALPVRSLEIEYGPSQFEFTFAPTTGIKSADDMILFRSAVKQICQRNGYYATFMCRPRIPNVVSSGWHLHQPLVHVADDTNAFMPTEPGAPLSLTGQRYLAGLLFPGGASNVEAHRYGGQASTGMLVDPDRDHVALALMQAAAARGLPMLAICRGFQEMNVAFGGTLHADIHACGHSGDHLEDPSEDLVTRYRYRHEVELTPGGILSALAGAQRVRVNSLHRQGVASLAPHLVVEARTPDGLIEASRLDGHAFAVGVQWHPEVMVDQDVLSRALFEAFGANCERYLREAATPE